MYVQNTSPGRSTLAYVYSYEVQYDISMVKKKRVKQTFSTMKNNNSLGKHMPYTETSNNCSYPTSHKQMQPFWSFAYKGSDWTTTAIKQYNSQIKSETIRKQLWPGLVSKNFHPKLSHRILRHIAWSIKYRRKKTNCTV